MPSFLKKYFWDVDFGKLTLRQNSSFVAARLLEYGDEQAIRWLFKNIENSIIIETLTKSRSLSNKSLVFWSSVFNIDKRKIPWLKKSYQKMQERHWIG
ncbi:MAG: hypothetical protein AAB583_05830 [Patescibacteria group bacterium]